MAKKKSKNKSIVFEFMQFAELEKLGSSERVKKILKIVRNNRIILLEGRFRKQEEAHLIQKTMESIDNKFKGIEIAVINPSRESASFIHRLRTVIANLLLGEREGFTLIGPATVISEIKQDPKKLNQLAIDLS
jgi:hypothetical protein